MNTSPGDFPRGRPATFLLFRAFLVFSALSLVRPVPADAANPNPNPNPNQSDSTVLAVPPPDDAPLICSARGCTRPAALALQWNNRKLHDPQRRKTWLACEAHREYLNRFLDDRGLLRAVVELNGP
jgi:hypothetical protein